MAELEKIKKPKRWKYKRYLFHVTDGMNVEKILMSKLSQDNTAAEPHQVK